MKYETFKQEVDNLLLKSDIYKNKGTKKYENEIHIFLSYIEEKGLEDKIYVLTKENIDDYFIFCIENNKLNSKNTLNTHISALKCLLDHMITEKFKYDELLGYISTQDFKAKIAKKLNDAKSKDLILDDTLKKTLILLDTYIENNEFDKLGSDTQKDKYLKVLFARIYIKLNIIIPLKVSEMIELSFEDFSESFRKIKINDIIIKIPNSLRRDIEFTLNFIKTRYNKNINNNYSFFQYITSPLSDELSTSCISQWFYTVFNTLEIDELLENCKSRCFTVEKFKKTAISSLINNDIKNIVYLSQLTGLSLETLKTECLNEWENDMSHMLNSEICKTEFYSYI